MSDIDLPEIPEGKKVLPSKMSDIDLPEIPELKKNFLNKNLYDNLSLMPQFKTYLSNRLLEYFKKNPSQNPNDTILSLIDQNDDFLANIFLSKYEKGKKYISDKNILKAVEKVINDSHESDAEKNADLIYILKVIIYVAYVNDENGSSSLPKPNQELQEYINNWKEPTGGKKTRKYRKRKNKKSKTNKNKKRKTKKRARQIY